MPPCAAAPTATAMLSSCGGRATSAEKEFFPTPASQENHFMGDAAEILALSGTLSWLSPLHCLSNEGVNVVCVWIGQKLEVDDC
ncbi:hypothetical protein PF005_g21219 [Phytophthora fragariae]|uniref:Uncharacterized protein n=1 Tax=Phytophthora fragariae TaxID=53985 RepID=A0A6A4CN48_9STRA|nr:hypothetical protein PF003_g27654 [Phytophthora fragariae]KAE8927609.1 hypothetical protein PF009_g22222 [Phytophthora fragariae]KAE8986962.1 hypothetical protein PF011_g19770 [Phytophthora fragariae]KAE9085084.1 hypothetical protein PF010_g20587 [Phytophthora fragariae]KAE9085625.1 hypothetical protein PF007_g21073 [Phytophthora fragariae]